MMLNVHMVQCAPSCAAPAGCTRFAVCTVHMIGVFSYVILTAVGVVRHGYDSRGPMITPHHHRYTSGVGHNKATGLLYDGATACTSHVDYM